MCTTADMLLSIGRGQGIRTEEGDKKVNKYMKVKLMIQASFAKVMTYFNIPATLLLVFKVSQLLKGADSNKKYTLVNFLTAIIIADSRKFQQ